MKTLKLIATIAALGACTISGMAQGNAGEQMLEQGTNWEVLRTYTTDGTPKFCIDTYEIDGTINIGEYSCARMMLKPGDSEAAPIEVGTLYAEGDKVYVVTLPSADRYLMYDFGAIPAEGLVCRMTNGHEALVTETSRQSVTNCNIEYEVIQTENYAIIDGETDYNYGSADRWIAGIGSSSTPVHNIQYDQLAGVGLRLWRVSRPGKGVVYEDAAIAEIVHTLGVTTISADTEADDEIRYNLNGTVRLNLAAPGIEVSRQGVRVVRTQR